MSRCFRRCAPQFCLQPLLREAQIEAEIAEAFVELRLIAPGSAFIPGSNPTSSRTPLP
jgi:hypothetical protein